MHFRHATLDSLPTTLPAFGPTGLVTVARRSEH